MNQKRPMETSTIQPNLRDSIHWSCIIAHKENTDQLEEALAAEGFEPVTQRLSHTEEEKRFASIIRCFLNHKRAWERASEIPGLSLIVEADFVPCRGFGSFTLPMPVSEMDRAMAWLYLCAGRFRRRIEGQFFLGSSTAVVAYVVSPSAARCLLEFAQQTFATIDPRQWYGFDGAMSPFLDERGVPMFLAFKNYGEHGGFMSPEHAQEGRTFRPHRAECLMGPLHFLPTYSRGRTGRFVAVRLFHKLKAVAKLAWGRTITRRALLELRSNAERLELVLAGLRRLLTLY